MARQESQPVSGACTSNPEFIRPVGIGIPGLRYDPNLPERMRSEAKRDFSVVS